MKERPLLEAFDRYFVLAVAMLAGLEALGEALEALFGGRLAELLAWCGVAALMAAGTYALQIVKSRRIPQMNRMYLTDGEPEVLLARWMLLGIVVAAAVLGVIGLVTLT